MSSAGERRRLFAYLEGTLSDAERDALTRELESSPSAGAELAEMERLLADLRENGHIGETDLTAGIRRAIDADSNAGHTTRAEARRPRPLFWVGALATVSILLGLGVALKFGVRRPDRGSDLAGVNAPLDDRLQPRGAADGGTGSAAANRWTDIEFFRVAKPGAQPKRLNDGDRLRQDDGLLLGYTNLGPKPYSFLAAFAVDEIGRAYWFYPAFTDRQQKPTSYPIRGGQHATPLPDVVQHSFRPGALTLVAIFSYRALTVEMIERAIERMFKKGRWTLSAATQIPLPVETAQLFQRARVQ